MIIYDSVANSTSRSANIKNFTLFEQDLASNSIPQWMFITPNMSQFLFSSFVKNHLLMSLTKCAADDGHDTNVTFASSWARGFLEPLLKNPNFNGPKTLILLSELFFLKAPWRHDQPDQQHSTKVVTMAYRTELTQSFWEPQFQST